MDLFTIQSKIVISIIDKFQKKKLSKVEWLINLLTNYNKFKKYYKQNKKEKYKLYH